MQQPLQEDMDQSPNFETSQDVGGHAEEHPPDPESAAEVEYLPQIQPQILLGQEVVYRICDEVDAEEDDCPCPRSVRFSPKQMDAATTGPRLQEEDEEERPSAHIKVRVVGIRFGYASKIYRFDPADLDLVPEDWVIVKTEKGLGLGRVASAPYEVEMDSAQLEGLRKVLRKAGKGDFDQRERLAQKEAEAYTYCAERIETLGLQMKLVAVECYFDGSKYIFYFTADGRVDFRELVKQLVTRFPVRIEMRQIGVRHEAKMVGGMACCGQELCCSRYLIDFRPVSVKMAKVQNLSLNPTKISGVCGRLMCCLGYEHEIYEAFVHGLPKVGRTVCTTKGQGPVVKYNPLDETISVRLDGDTIVDVRKDEILDDLGKRKSEQARDQSKPPTGSDKGNGSDSTDIEGQPDLFT
jgi:cell fate regulator YaaT (PSP1 superfamily)